MINRISGLATILLAAGGLAACATVQPRYDAANHHDHDRRQSDRHRDYAGRSHDRGERIPGTMRPYQVAGRTYTPRDQPGYDETGTASWYGPQFHARSTANGEIFDMDRPSAAHTTLPLPSLVEVTNLENGRRIRVRVNDRGPFVGNRIIDLSRAAAQQLGFYQQGTARVRVRYIGPAGPALGDDLRLARNDAPPPRSENDRREDRRDEPRPRAEYRAVNEIVPASGPLRVQVGAFASRMNAEHAAEQVGGAGTPTIDTVQSRGATLYRVTLGPTRDLGAAQSMRDRVAVAGFPDARIIGF